MNTTDEISKPLNPFFASRGEFCFKRKGVDMRFNTVCLMISRLILKSLTSIMHKSPVRIAQ
jgi:hypothetical protein